MTAKDINKSIVGRNVLFNGKVGVIDRLLNQEGQVGFFANFFVDENTFRTFVFVERTNEKVSTINKEDFVSTLDCVELCEDDSQEL